MHYLPVLEDSLDKPPLSTPASSVSLFPSLVSPHSVSILKLTLLKGEPISDCYLDKWLSFFMFSSLFSAAAFCTRLRQAHQERPPLDDQ